MTSDEYFEIPRLAMQGVSVAEIAQRLGRERKTVRKYLKASTDPPTCCNCRVHQRLLVQFAGYLKMRVAQGCANGKVLLREIQEQGYKGSYSTLKHFLKPLRDAKRTGGGEIVLATRR